MPSNAGAWVQATLEHFGHFDSVIHCAGIFSRVPVVFENGQEEEIQRLFDVNVMGPWWLTRAAWPQLATHGSGRIVVLVSMSGKRTGSSGGLQHQQVRLDGALPDHAQ